MLTRQPHFRKFGLAPRRGGAVIILSLALLMSLLFLGLFFFSFIDDEGLSADIYAEQFTGDDVVFDAQQVLDFGLMQVVVGTNHGDDTTTGVADYYAPHSALTGGRYSLLAHILGPIGEDLDNDGTLDGPEDANGNGVLDPGEDVNGNGRLDPGEDTNGNGEIDYFAPSNFEPYSGAGIRFYNDAGTIKADIDGDGSFELTSVNQLRLNRSDLSEMNAVNNPTDYDPDAGYTYPDANSLFLYHESQSPTTGELFIKPSFDVPGTLYWTGNFVAGERVLRPHVEHVYTDGTERYLTSPTAALSGDTSRTIQPFETNLTNDPANYGVWTGTANNYTDLHGDADADGTRDSFLIDLDHPLLTFADGRQGVPLYFWRVEDADALVNLNTAGDMPIYRVAERSGSTRSQVLNGLFNDNRFLTMSNHGFSPSEISPGIPLYADPTNNTFIDGANQAAAADQFDKFYDEQAGIANASSSAGRLQMSNTELLKIMSGSHTYDSAGNPQATEFDIVGRYGEKAGIPQTSNAFAAAGTTLVDDDNDSNTGTRPAGGAFYANEQFRDKSGNPTTGAVAMPPSLHPLDPSGYATWLQVEPGIGMKRVLRASPDAVNPMGWLYYAETNVPQFSAVVSMWQFPVSGGVGVLPWVGAIATGFLQYHDPGSPRDVLQDEPDEMVVDSSDAGFANPDDQPFGASEMTALHASNGDWTALASVSRLRSLAPVNFTINYLAQQIRRQFTTVSWDRPEFSSPWSAGRLWESTYDTTDRSRKFPPKFGPIATPIAPNEHETGSLSALDPFRPETRRLLTVDFNAKGGNLTPQNRLELNGILSDDSTAGGAECFDTNGNPRFRPLVPHPALSGGAVTFNPGDLNMLHSNTAAPPYAFNAIGANPKAQEWWARHDRQRLARDIYVMLWLLGSTTDSASLNPYTPAQIREMAQFAVNAVDAMDHDNVITKFEYDDNLADGWSWTPGGPEVFGVEAQRPTFSEVLWINSKQITDAMGSPVDHVATLYDDATGDRHFLFMELRNALPFNINLGNDTYRIRRLEGGTEQAALTFDGAIASAPTVGAGENYIIGTHSDPSWQVVGGANAGKVQGSVFWLDHQINAPSATNLEYYELVPYIEAPDRPVGVDLATARQTYPQPRCDLDLCHERDRVLTPRFVESGSGAGYFLSSVAASMTPPTAFELVLERRQNMQVDGAMSDDSLNAWVEVDRVTARERPFELADQNANRNAVRSEFRNNCYSQERREPFYPHLSGAGSGLANPSQPGDGLIDYGVGGVGPENGFLKHSLGGPTLNVAIPNPYHTGAMGGVQPAPDSSLKHQRNSVLPSGNRPEIWQPHFDRGFTSVYDLLSVTFLSPDGLIFHDRTASPPEGGLVEAGGNGPTARARMTGIHAASMRFTNPQLTLPAHLSAHQPEHYANRWYRLLEFLSVPSHTSDEVKDDMTLRRRIPGRINLNTIRSEHNLAAVINDPDQISIYNVNAPTVDSYTGSRNWYDELLRLRDGMDGSGDPLPPGTAESRPFRPLSFDDPLFPNDPLGGTILRRGRNANDFDKIGLFEARTPGDAVNGTPGNRDRIDWHTRERLLSKIANLTTNRSHVYVIWGGFQFHEAHETASGQVQIGAQMTDIDVYRELIVVDMSRMEEGFDGEQFTFEPFILHREVLP
ncbi:MAG: hypothetical protein R3B90_17700 [Planctomycetaceae bacterium]